jgi:hypothetical protein
MHSSTRQRVTGISGRKAGPGALEAMLPAASAEEDFDALANASRWDFRQDNDLQQRLNDASTRHPGCPENRPHPDNRRHPADRRIRTRHSRRRQRHGRPRTHRLGRRGQHHAPRRIPHRPHRQGRTPEHSMTSSTHPRCLMPISRPASLGLTWAGLAVAERDCAPHGLGDASESC